MENWSSPLLWLVAYATAWTTVQLLISDRWVSEWYMLQVLELLALLDLRDLLVLMDLPVSDS